MRWRQPGGSSIDLGTREPAGILQLPADRNCRVGRAACLEADHQ